MAAPAVAAVGPAAARRDLCDLCLQAYGSGQFYPGMPGGRFIPPHQQPVGPGYAPPAAGGYSSYAPPAGQSANMLRGTQPPIRRTRTAHTTRRQAN